MDFNKSIEDIFKILDELREENKSVPIIVEGEKDKQALKNLNIKNKIIILNKGISLIDFCDIISKKYDKIIILTDWDRKGGFLKRRILENLKGRVKCNLKYREFFAKNTVVKTVEGLPHLIDTLINKNVNGKER